MRPSTGTELSTLISKLRVSGTGRPGRWRLTKQRRSAWKPVAGEWVYGGEEEEWSPGQDTPCLCVRDSKPKRDAGGVRGRTTKWPERSGESDDTRDDEMIN